MRSESNSKYIYFLFALICVIFGHTFLAIGIGIKSGATPLFFAATRFTIAGFLLTVSLLVFGKLKITGGTGIFIAKSCFISLFITVGTFGFTFMAQTGIDSGFMARLDSFGPVLTAVFTAFFLGKKLKAGHILAFTMGISGSILIASPAVEASPVHLGYAVGAVISYALGNALYHRIFTEEADPVSITAIQSFSGGIILMIFSLILEEPKLPAEAFIPLGYLVIFGSIIGHSATLILVKQKGAVFAMGWLYVAPVVATLSGALVLSEKVGVRGIVGTALCLLGVFILGRSERKPRPNASPEAVKI